MKPRFQPDVEPSSHPPVIPLLDPEAYDSSEQHFAASLEAKAVERRFIVDVAGAGSSEGEESGVGPTPAVGSEMLIDQIAKAEIKPGQTENSTTNPPPSADPDAWRREVAAKISRYRANRRPRAPRYPSLQLKFGPSDSGAAVRELAITENTIQPEEAIPESDPPIAPTAKIIEFPVFSPPPVFIDELAEPVLGRPRILEVPEIVPPPPALGGILIEPAENTAQEKRQGFELPLIGAPFSRRILAAAIDAALVALALAMFAYAFRIAAFVPPLREAAGIAAAMLGIFWAGYEYLHLVYAGATPGLILMKLRLTRFDGSPVPRKLRRWRVLASLLSGLSLGLGYAWCFLDEDQLCWHDRITHTYMAPKTSN